jgi:hypothetical protein
VPWSPRRPHRGSHVQRAGCFGWAHEVPTRLALPFEVVLSEGVPQVVVEPPSKVSPWYAVRLVVTLGPHAIVYDTVSPVTSYALNVQAPFRALSIYARPAFASALTHLASAGVTQCVKIWVLPSTVTVTSYSPAVTRSAARKGRAAAVIKPDSEVRRRSHLILWVAIMPVIIRRTFVVNLISIE